MNKIQETYIHLFLTTLGQLLDISPKNLKFLKTLHSAWSYIEIWFTDQNSKLLEIEHKMNITTE